MADIAPEERMTPSALLMGALEDIDQCQECMIIKVNAEGSIEWHSTTTVIHKKLGMIEAVKQWIVRGMTE